MAHKNIVLFGFMGTGKTHIGKEVAHKLDMTFVDMDDLIIGRAGKSIPEIFADDGENHFRALERQVVVDLSHQSGLVIATGGGVIKNPENVSDLGSDGLEVCLTARPEVILGRVEHDTSRPLLNTDDRLVTIQTLLHAREHLYNSIPNQIDTSDMTVDEVVEKIVTM